jgi:hypothetical protein
LGHCGGVAMHDLPVVLAFASSKEEGRGVWWCRTTPPEPGLAGGSKFPQAISNLIEPTKTRFWLVQ